MVSASSLARYPPPNFSAEGGCGAAAHDPCPTDALGGLARSRCTEPSAKPEADGAVGKRCGSIELQVRRLHMRTCMHVSMAARTPARSAERSADALDGPAPRRCVGRPRPEPRGCEQEA